MLLQLPDTKEAADTKEADTKEAEPKEADTKEAVLATGHISQRRGWHKSANWSCSVAKK